MSWISPRLLIALGAVVVIWAGAHALTGHPAAISPVVWPSASAPSGAAQASLAPLGSLPPPAPDPHAAAPVPVLPGVLRHLDDNTGRTATGLYTILQQLEGAVASNIKALVGQLEPHR